LIFQGCHPILDVGVTKKLTDSTKLHANTLFQNVSVSNNGQLIQSILILPIILQRNCYYIYNCEIVFQESPSQTTVGVKQNVGPLDLSYQLTKREGIPTINQYTLSTPVSPSTNLQLNHTRQQVLLSWIPFMEFCCQLYIFNNLYTVEKHKHAF